MSRRSKRRPEHHGEAPLLLAPAALGHQLGHAGGVRRVEVGRVEEAHRVAVAGHPVDRLAQPLHLPALERELPRVHHRLVADVEEAHARRLVGRQPLLAGAHDAEAPPVAVDVAAERVPHVGPLGERADGVGRDQADAAEDGVGDERVAVEEPLLVVAQREVVERAGAVPAHDVARPELGGAPAHRGPSRRQAAVDHRPGQQVQRHHDEADADGQQADGGVAVDGGREGDPVARRRGARPSRGARRASRGAGGGARGRPPPRATKPPRVAIDPADGEDDEGGDEGGRLGLGPEALALDDQQREDAGAHDERDDVGGVDEVQGERGDEQRHGDQPGAALAPAGCRGRA